MKNIPIILLLFVSLSLVGQDCSGVLGDNIFIGGDFGSGSEAIVQEDPGYADLTYKTDSWPDDGEYTVLKDMSDLSSIPPTWRSFQNNDSDADGYFMLVNANFSPSTFFKQSIRDACPNTTYFFSADIINVQQFTLFGTKPNISFLINGVERFTTGDISYSGAWETYGFSFTTSDTDTLINLELRNNARGGLGNDLGLDNIAFRPCLPKAEIPDLSSFCTFSESITLNASEAPSIVWERSTDGQNWDAISGVEQTSINISYQESVLYRYRSAGNNLALSLEGCHSISPQIELANTFTNTLVFDTICAGETSLYGGYSLAGQYIDTLTEEGSCDEVRTLNLYVLEKADYSITIEYNCGENSVSIDNIPEGATYTLNESVASLPFINLDEGQYEVFIQHESFCDTTIIFEIEAVTAESIVQYSDTICLGDTVQMFGRSFYESGEYFDTTITDGCVQVQKLNLLIRDKPTALFSFDTTCTGIELLLSQDAESSYFMDGSPITNYVLGAGTYELSVQSIHGCTSRYPIEVQATDFRSHAQETIRDTICEGDSIKFLNRLLYNAGIYSDTISRNGCDSIIHLELFVKDNIGLEYELISEDCSSQLLVIDDFEKATWQINQQALTQNSISLINGSYELERTDALGCKATSTLDVLPNELSVTMGEDTTIVLGESLLIKLDSDGAYERLDWQTSLCKNCLDTIVTPVRDEQIILRATDAANCVVYDTLNIFVSKDREIVMPNIFMPNRGVNRYFKVPTQDQELTVRTFQVFSRWGELLYEEKNQPLEKHVGWDGMFKQELLRTGLYVYRVEITFKDGYEAHFEGDFTLVD